MYVPVSYDGREYVQIADMDALSSDDDGYAPLYNLIWLLDNPETELAEDTVSNWETVSEIKKAGEIIKTGDIY